jgi:hypothetical protein
MRSNMVRVFAGIAGVLAITAFGHVAQGTTYVIDPTQSSLQIAVQTQGIPITLPQFSGSDIESLLGTLDVTIAGGNITFNASPGSIAFASQAGIYPDATGGSPANGTVNALPDTFPSSPNIGSTQVANYGLVLIVPSDPGDPLNLDTAAIAGYAAIHSALASLTGSAALSGGSFPASGLTIATDAGNLDYNINTGNGDGPPQTSTAFQNGTTGIGGNSGPNSLAGNGSVVTAGGFQTITVPVNVDVLVDTGTLVVDAIFVGQIVAKVAVPEPSTFALAGLGLVALVPMVRRRFRKA